MKHQSYDIESYSVTLVNFIRGQANSHLYMAINVVSLALNIPTNDGLGASFSFLSRLITEKSCFLHMRKQSRKSAAWLITAFVFTIYIVQSLYMLIPKFQASSYFMWLHSLVCVRLCWKP